MNRYLKLKKRNGSRGYTLLEYCAGAAVIAGIVYGALQTFGTSLGGFFTGLGQWAENQTGQFNSGNGNE